MPGQSNLRLRHPRSLDRLRQKLVLTVEAKAEVLNKQMCLRVMPFLVDSESGLLEGCSRRSKRMHCRWGISMGTWMAWTMSL